MELTREEAIRLHRELWGWLAISGSTDKTDYLKRHGYKGIINDCFLCEFAKMICKDCPVKWERIGEGHGGGNPCMKSHYGEWLIIDTPEERSRLAALIRDLPEKAEKKETPAPRFAVGQKVVPVSKSIGEFAGDLDSEPNWIDSKKRGYFYVTQSFQHCGKQAYGCHSEDIRKGGNYFLESDLTPYVEPKPAAFKAGDRVRIRPDLVPKHIYDGLTLYPSIMASNRGQKTVITRSWLEKGYTYYHVADNPFSWSEPMLELVADEPKIEPKPAFKVGDRVKVTLSSLFGRVGVIAEISGDSYGVEFSEPIRESSRWNENHPEKAGRGRYFRENTIELLLPLNHCPAPKTVTLETVTVTFKDNKTTCIIENELGRFKGCAKCSPEDVWDEQTGAELAKVRAYRKMLEVGERNIRMI